MRVGVLAADASPCASPPIELRQVGFGVFGSFMHGLMSEESASATAGPSTRRMSVSPASTIVRSKTTEAEWQSDVLQNPAVRAVYIASPDHLHTPQVNSHRSPAQTKRPKLSLPYGPLICISRSRCTTA